MGHSQKAIDVGCVFGRHYQFGWRILVSRDRVHWSAKPMERASKNANLKHIYTLFEVGSLCGLTDRQLLDLFVARDADGDDACAEAAFEVLVRRHGPMVLRM